ncbi:tetratricopeptide repeat protein [uncultured Thiodictyon sp.]|uniref:nSTAND1 domain-containing NTPase n=1 Tax=uncultured Thiodictyon sp. TaxID=1846217 RepID=UPI0025EF4E28|nr:tetratricopeptide repeat protein [uncultured Thiodictyon sp.]
MTDWPRERQELHAYYDRMRGRAVALEEELNAALNSLDLVTALIRARRALEVIVIELCERELKRERGTEPLAGLLPRFRDLVPDAVLAAMGYVNQLGNLGAHPNKPIADQEVRQAFVALAAVVGWYIIDYRHGFGEALGPVAPGAAPPPVIPNPYLGLDSFQEKDAERFFGREALVGQDLWPDFQALMAGPPRFLALLGPSGSGKSSVARAGLLPRIKAGMPCRLLTLTPTHAPLAALANALARHALPDDPAPAGKAEEFRALLAADGQGLSRIATLLWGPDRVPLVLLLDQAEELFSLCPDAAEQGRFLDNLLAAVNDPTPHLYLLLTLRSDFLGETQRFPAFNTLLTGHERIVPVLDEAGLRLAIAEPARLAGQPLDAAAVQLLLEQSADRPGALPLLQYALTEVWRGLQTGQSAAQTLNACGGVGGALAGRAQQVYTALTPAAQAVARRCLLRLVQLGEGGPDTRRRVALDDLLAEDETRADLLATLRRFAAADARFLTVWRGDDGREQVEITHDALIAHWGTLRDWLAADRDDLRLAARLEAAAKHWEGQREAAGLLWRRPDLDLLRRYAQRHGTELTALQGRFYRAAARRERRERLVKGGSVAALLVLTLTALGAAWWDYRAERVATLARGQAEDLINYMLFDLRDKLEPIGRLELLDGVSRKAAEYFEKLPADRVSADSERKRGVALHNVGAVRRAQGDLAGALTAYQAGLAIFERLARQDPANAWWQCDLGLSHEKIGGVCEAQGDLAGELTAYEASLAIRERLARQDPDNAGWQSDLANSHEKIGSVRQAEGDQAGTLTAYEASLAIRERLARQDPDNAEWQRALSISHDDVGDVRRAKGDLAGALTAHEAGFAIIDRLARLDPANAEWQRELAVNHERIGEVLQAQGNLAGALAAYEASLSISERLARQDLANAKWQRDLAFSHRNIGEVRQAQGDLVGALTAYEASLSIRERLARQDPANAEWQRDLAVSHEDIGDVRQAQGDLAGARTAYEEALAITERQARQDPANAGWQHDLSVSHEKIGYLRRFQDDLAGALTAFEASLLIRERLARQNPANARWQSGLAVSHRGIGMVRRAQGDLVGARASYEQALAIALPLFAQTQAAEALDFLDSLYGDLVLVASVQGDSQAALRYQRESVAQWRKIGDPPALAQSLLALYDLEDQVGDTKAALATNTEALTIARDLYQRQPDDTSRALLVLVLGNRSFVLLFDRQYREAIAAAEEALALDPSQIVWATNQAHGYLLSGQFDQAQAIYRVHAHDQVNDGTFAAAVLDDFAKLRQRGIDHPDMKRIEALLKAGEKPAATAGKPKPRYERPPAAMPRGANSRRS